MTEVERMEIRDLFEEGVSVSELARRYGHDRKTIREAIRSGDDTKKGASAVHANKGVSAIARWPKADGIACPKVAG